MNSLLLDSTYKDLNVGLKKGNDFFKTSYECYQQQSELMIPEIEKILKSNNVNPKDIQEIVVTEGPGSYTGLRIALTIAKIYSYIVKCPCYSLSSLNVLMKKDCPSICLMNARSGRSYFGVYLNNKCIEEDAVLENDKVLDYISKHPDYVVCGDANYLGVEGYKADLLENMYFLKNEENKVKDIYSLKAKYLKD